MLEGQIFQLVLSCMAGSIQLMELLALALAGFCRAS